MRHTRFALSALIAGALVSACSPETPTSPATPLHPALDVGGGGGWMGGGGRIDTGATSADAEGGGWMGGGGKVAPTDSTGVQPR